MINKENKFCSIYHSLVRFGVFEAHAYETKSTEATYVICFISENDRGMNVLNSLCSKQLKESRRLGRAGWTSRTKEV